MKVLLFHGTRQEALLASSELPSRELSEPWYAGEVILGKSCRGSSHTGQVMLGSRWIVWEPACPVCHIRATGLARKTEPASIRLSAMSALSIRAYLRPFGRSSRANLVPGHNLPPNSRSLAAVCTVFPTRRLDKCPSFCWVNAFAAALQERLDVVGHWFVSGRRSRTDASNFT
jgi:hypothetical protein